MASSGTTGELAGAIVTPTIDLSHNDGQCNVTLRAYGQSGDWLVVRATNSAAYAGIEFPDSGIVERTVSVPLCTERENLTFYSNNYRPFLIDYIRVTQDVKAGDRVTIVDKSVVTADNTVQSVDMTQAALRSESDTEYRVTAFRYYHGNTEDIWNSKASENTVVCRADASGVDTPMDVENGVHVVDGGIVVTTTASATMCIYDASGSLLIDRQAPQGTTFQPLRPGLYIVKTAGRATKVVVR